VETQGPLHQHAEARGRPGTPATQKQQHTPAHAQDQRHAPGNAPQVRTVQRRPGQTAEQQRREQDEVVEPLRPRPESTVWKTRAPQQITAETQREQRPEGRQQVAHVADPMSASGCGSATASPRGKRRIDRVRPKPALSTATAKPKALVKLPEQPLSQRAMDGPKNWPMAKNRVAKLKAMGMSRGATWSVALVWIMANRPLIDRPMIRKWKKNTGSVWANSGRDMAPTTRAME